jgi:hypothetical protein
LRESSERKIVMQNKNMHPKKPGTGNTTNVKSFPVGYYQRHRSRLSVLAAVIGILFVVLLVAFSVSPIVPSIFTNTLTAIRARGATCEHGGHTQTESSGTVPTAQLTTVLQFPTGYFLEDVAVRADGSMLVIVVNKNELWYLPAPTGDNPVQPLLLYTFDQHPFHLVETTRDVFYVDTTNYLTDHASSLLRVDLRHWEPGMPVPVQPVLTFPFPVLALNGADKLSPNVILVADAGAGLIWRVDLSADGMKGTARIWLKDPSMNTTIAGLRIKQPGINGLEYDEQTHFVYYTSTAQQLFMRVPVDPTTLDPAGDPELVATGSMWDDFAIDEYASVAYATTHRQNTIERVPLDPHSCQAKQTVAGIPFDERLAGPAAVAWGRGPQDYGSVAYVSTDGGVTAPPDGVVRPAKVLRIEL